MIIKIPINTKVFLVEEISFKKNEPLWMLEFRLKALEYYSNAMNSFEDVIFFVFSDDINWCKQQAIFDNKNVVFQLICF